MTQVVFKTNAAYQLSTTFYDRWQRKTGYIAPAAARVNIPDRAYTYNDFITGILWSLSNANALQEIPVNAWYYSIDLTKCLRTRFFEQLRGRDAAYAVKDTDGNYTFTTAAYATNLAGTAFDISSLLSVNMGYVFSEGDIIKIYLSGSTTVYSLSINAQVGNWVVAELQNLGTLNAGTPYLFEIYTPYKPSTNEPEYEVGRMYAINNPGTNSRQYSTLAGILTGDVYLLTRYGGNTVNYNLPAGSIISVADFTLGCSYVSQTATDSLFGTGSSPLRNLVGWDISTDTTRLIIKSFAVPLTLKIHGTITVTAFGGYSGAFLPYVADNNSNSTNLTPTLHLSSGVPLTQSIDVNLTLAANSRLFILGNLTPGFTLGQSLVFDATNLFIEVVNSTVGPYTTENMSPNDKYYKNWFTDAGRPNLIDTIGQSQRVDGISYSDTIVEGSKNNGLSSFSALNTQDLDYQMGALQKLQLTSKVQQQGSIMLAICSKETASLYLGEVQVVGSDSNAFLSSAPNVIGTINILKGSFGTMNPESALEYKGIVVWLDANNGKIIQYGENGLFPISSYKTNKFWKLFSETYLSLTDDQIEALGSRPFVFTGIDPNSGEILVSVPRVLENPPKGYLPDYPDMVYPWDLWDGQAKALVYNLYAEPNNWGGSFNITAEGFIYAGNVLYGFKNGGLWKFGKETPPFNNFFGVQYKSRIMFLCNANPNKPKVLNNVALEANMTPTLTYFRTEQPYIQASDLMDFDWENKEGMLYAAAYNNKLTPSATGLQPNGLITGEKMRSIVIKILVEFDVTTGALEFRFFNTGFSISLGHTT